MLRKHDKPLQQIIKRYEEICINDKIKFINQNYNTFTINKPNCFVLTTDGEVVEIVEILSKSAAIVGKKFKNKEDLYKKPMKSSKLDIYIVKNKSENTNKWYIYI